MTHRTVICVLLVVVVGVALGCSEPVDEPTPPVQGVRAPEVDTPDVTAKTPEQDAAAPPATPAPHEPAKVEEHEPAQSDEPELVTTTFPPLGMHIDPLQRMTGRQRWSGELPMPT